MQRVCLLDRCTGYTIIKLKLHGTIDKKCFWPRRENLVWVHIAHIVSNMDTLWG